MAHYSIFCEECVEDIPSHEIQWQDDRLYCGRCGAELEPPEGDVFEQIARNRSAMVFRDEEEPEEDEEEEGLPVHGEDG